MKPLELVIFPAAPPEPHDPWEGTGAEDMGHFDWRLDREEENRLIQSKRFTDAELAAEVWRQESQVTTVEAMGGTPVRNIEALRTICRFASLPHYDEAQS